MPTQPYPKASKEPVKRTKITYVNLLLGEARKTSGITRIRIMDKVFEVIDEGYFTLEDIDMTQKKLDELALLRWYQKPTRYFIKRNDAKTNSIR